MTDLPMLITLDVGGPALFAGLLVLNLAAAIVAALIVYVLEIIHERRGK